MSLLEDEMRVKSQFIYLNPARTCASCKNLVVINPDKLDRESFCGFYGAIAGLANLVFVIKYPVASSCTNFKPKESRT